MRLKYITLLGLVPLLMVAAAACAGGNPAATSSPVPAATTPTTPAEVSTGAVDFTVILEGTIATGGGTFVPDTLEMEAGKTYTIELIGRDEFHTWSVEDPTEGFVANVSLVAEATETIQFTAPAAGTYRVICIPHEAYGMLGTIVVK